MSLYDKFVENKRLRRFILLLIVIALFYLFRSMMSLFLLTFIFTFLSVQFVRAVQKKFPKIKPIWIITPIYLIIIALLIFVITNYVPQLITQTVKMFKSLQKFYESKEVRSNPYLNVVYNYLQQINLDNQIKGAITQVVNYISSVGAIGFNIVISFLLSFFYTSQVEQMNSFGRQFLKSNYSWIFSDLFYYGKKFVNTFGVVLEAQLMIAVVNTALTTITLLFMKMPGVLALAVMVFLLSLIPVAGVIISLIPLSFVAYSVGGIRYVIYIVIMIVVIHLIETYFLNPQFMSSMTHLPIFFTFVVLIVSEELLGTWGLIIGIPIFVFFLDILGVHSIKKGDKKPRINLKKSL
ncbi:AI-2E family transporter [Companilactobacillus crustorum]|uniref:Permease n=3 Tax=Companilactobacillus TaxID=2767879 RepID=A0A837RFV4_9LACO|nr:AI-2E family transporter [Companilactobacillus crustorum]HCD07767.1 AI-2E family transporter [Lactobacillus sp.]KRK41909.1 permease [Companilactobacillus crustorum JCM 15951]KRO19808.1 permease [Companilactobacillus crustorum]WDT65810.1 AI-2E family transporter [Companilactobacillus crustorum]GEO77391.1 AI-2E family transporter [Companilactobacillus crustorum]